MQEFIKENTMEAQDEDTAEEIIELRDRLRHFSNTYELLYVESLTQSEVADILEYVTVE